MIIRTEAIVSKWEKIPGPSSQALLMASELFAFCFCIGPGIVMKGTVAAVGLSTQLQIQKGLPAKIFFREQGQTTIFCLFLQCSISFHITKVFAIHRIEHDHRMIK